MNAEPDPNPRLKLDEWIRLVGDKRLANFIMRKLRGLLPGVTIEELQDRKQEVFRKLARRYGTDRKFAGQWKNILCPRKYPRNRPGVIRSVAIDYLRKTRRRLPEYAMGDEDKCVQARPTTSRHTSLGEVKGASQLTKLQRVVLRLHYWKDLNLTEIAARLKRYPSDIFTIRERAIAKLKLYY